jgi:hypothetical protein
MSDAGFMLTNATFCPAHGHSPHEGGECLPCRREDLERAALSALEAWDKAVTEREAATDALKEATANSYPTLWEREHAAVKDEHEKRFALRDAADSLRRARADEGGEE